MQTCNFALCGPPYWRWGEKGAKGVQPGREQTPIATRNRTMVQETRNNRRDVQKGYRTGHPYMPALAAAQCRGKRGADGPTDWLQAARARHWQRLPSPTANHPPQEPLRPPNFGQPTLDKAACPSTPLPQTRALPLEPQLRHRPQRPLSPSPTSPTCCSLVGRRPMPRRCTRRQEAAASAAALRLRRRTSASAPRHHTFALAMRTEITRGEGEAAAAVCLLVVNDGLLLISSDSLGGAAVVPPMQNALSLPHRHAGARDFRPNPPCWRLLRLRAD